MEIYAEVENFTFYESSKTFYISAKVLEKRLKPGCHPNSTKFEEVEIQESISLKANETKIAEAGQISLEELSVLLLSRFLIFDINLWEAPHARKNSTPKFGIINARKCATFLGN